MNLQDARCNNKDNSNNAVRCGEVATFAKGLGKGTGAKVVDVFSWKDILFTREKREEIYKKRIG